MSIAAEFDGVPPTLQTVAKRIQDAQPTSAKYDAIHQSGNVWGLTGVRTVERNGRTYAIEDHYDGQGNFKNGTRSLTDGGYRAGFDL